MKKCVIIYNPVSGKKTFKNQIDYVTNRLTQAGYFVEVFSTNRPKHAISIAKEVCDSTVDLLVVSGGDGTLHEVVNGIAHCEKSPTIGYIPSGTACDIASTLRIPKNIDKALDIILEGVPTKMDIVKSNNGYFMYVTAIGTYVDISYVTDSKLKKYFGYFAYLLTGIKEFFTIPMIKTKIEYDDGFKRGLYSLIIVVNSKKVAGFNIVTKPVLDDGKVDVVLYKYVPLFNNIIYFISFLLSPKVLPGVTRIKTSKLKIYTDHHHKWNTDGESSNAGNLNLEVKKQAIEIIIPEDTRKKYFKEQDYGKESNSSK